MVTLTLIYLDGSTFLVGGFPDLDSCNAWIAQEQTRPYWQAGTQTQIAQANQPESQFATGGGS